MECRCRVDRSIGPWGIEIPKVDEEERVERREKEGRGGEKGQQSLRKRGIHYRLYSLTKHQCSPLPLPALFPSSASIPSLSLPLPPPSPLLLPPHLSKPKRPQTHPILKFQPSQPKRCQELRHLRPRTLINRSQIRSRSWCCSRGKEVDSWCTFC